MVNGLALRTLGLAETPTIWGVGVEDCPLLYLRLVEWWYGRYGERLCYNKGGGVGGRVVNTIRWVIVMAPMRAFETSTLTFVGRVGASGERALDHD